MTADCELAKGVHTYQLVGISRQKRAPLEHPRFCYDGQSLGCRSFPITFAVLKMCQKPMFLSLTGLWLERKQTPRNDASLCEVKGNHGKGVKLASAF